MLGLTFAAMALLGDVGGGSPAPQPTPATVIGSTGETVYNGAQIKAMGGQNPKLTDGSPDPDVSALHKQGIQGEMKFSGYVGSDGLMHDVVLTKSSHSKELDDVGLGLVKGSKFRPGSDAAGKPVAVRVIFPVYLWKDSMMDPAFFKKTCADFVADADWHAKAFPDEAPDDLRGWELANGAILTMAYTNGTSMAKSVDFQTAYAACKAKPGRKFFDVLHGR